MRWIQIERRRGDGVEGRKGGRADRIKEGIVRWRGRERVDSV